MKAEVLFILSAVVVAYTYLGYPVAVWVLGRLFPRPVHPGDGLPRMSVIVAAHNEERDIGAKIENTLKLDYPPSHLDIIVVSDCSTDATDAVVSRYAGRGVRLVRLPQRQGKTGAQNAAVTVATGEVLLFTDATTAIEPSAPRRLVRNFADPTVGCVAGRLLYIDRGGTGIGYGTRSYWSYETWVRESESRFNSVIGTSGCLYAVHRRYYHPLRDEACSDFLIAALMVRQGVRAVFDPTALCTEITNRKTDKELRMRVRIVTQTLSDLWTDREILNPFRYGVFALQLISHKVLRYLMPYALLTLLGSSAVLAERSPVFLVATLLQLAVPACALVGWGLERFGFSSPPIALPQYFVVSNLASILGLFQFLRGKRYAAWQPQRDNGTTQFVES